MMTVSIRTVVLASSGSISSWRSVVLSRKETLFLKTQIPRLPFSPQLAFELNLIHSEMMALGI